MTNLKQERSCHVALDHQRASQDRTLAERRPQLSGNRGFPGKSKVNDCPGSQETSEGESGGRIQPDTELLHSSQAMQAETCVYARPVLPPMQHMIPMQRVLLSISGRALCKLGGTAVCLQRMPGEESMHTEKAVLCSRCCRTGIPKTAC